MNTASMQKDVYKEFHGRAYHPGVTEVYSNFVSRSNKLSNVPNNTHVAFVGLQYFIKSYLQEEWGTFFALPKEEAVANHARILSAMLGYKVDVSYLEDLHDLGYLPLRIKALPEGSLVPYQVSPLTIVNTKPGFQWLTNMVETVLSCENWPIQTSCTTAVAYLKVFKEFAERTGLDPNFCPFQGHDFSFRGMFGKQAAAMSGFGHLASGLVGTDTIPAVLFAEQYYNANVDHELVGCSVDATEHSVTCSWIEEGEEAFAEYLMEHQSPTGILSVVADTWDFWDFVNNILPMLYSKIMEREGTFVVRPDSGDPVKILTGWTPDEVAEYNKGLHADLKPCEIKGLIECLWETFGGTYTEKGYKLLDSHIGAIYGDAINLERQREILERLAAKGFASKIVLGIGSFSYQYVTRDCHASAVKATSIVKNGERIAIFKDPKTDTGKRSAKGLLRVERDVTGEFIMYDDQTEEQEQAGLLELVYENGKLLRETSLAEIRSLINSQI